MTLFLNKFKIIRTTLLWSMLLGIIISSCDKNDSTPVVPADKTALDAKIALAAETETGTV